MSQIFKELKVLKIKHLTSDSTEITLDMPNTSFSSGQYITIEAEINQEHIRRAYSICSGELENEIKIAVKRVPMGKMSTFLVDKLKEGDILKVCNPEGNFVQTWNPNRKATHFFIAAGSGITPMMSMIKTGLEKEPLSTFILLYGNKEIGSVMFREELHDIESKYQGQFFLYHTYSQQSLSLKEKLQMRFKRAQKEKPQLKGRINISQVESILDSHNLKFELPYFYICGPGKMIGDMNEAILKVGGVKKSNILKEHFTNDDQKDIDTSSLDFSEVQLLITQMDGTKTQIAFPKTKTLLEGMEDAGLDAPFSCLNGVCSSCIAQVVEGKTEMKTCLALDDDEIAQGKTLTCQTMALTEKVHISYDDE